MREALERILGYLPTYLRTLPNVILGPKAFIRDQFAYGERQLENSLVFLGISFLIAWVLKSPFGNPSFMDLAADAVFLFVGVLAYGAAILGVWRIVGGRAPVQKVFITHFYYSGVLHGFYSGFFLLVMGAIRISNPDYYKFLFANLRNGNMKAMAGQESMALIDKAPASLIVYFVGLLVMFAWFFLGWGAYRELNLLSKSRSFFAALLFLLAFFLISALLSMMAVATIK